MATSHDAVSPSSSVRRLSSAQALDAVVGPSEASGRRFAPGVAEAFVKALREQPATSSAAPSYEGEDVEPVQLQIVCRTFFDRLPSEVTEISAEHVARYADVQQALVGFYEQAIAAAIKRHAGVRERRVRLWFERQLITPARTRGIVFQGERTTAGLPNQVVRDLEERRVVRSEPRGPALWYELTHDRLIDAVLGSNRVWYARGSRLIARRAAAAVGAVGLLATVLLVVSWWSWNRSWRELESGLPGNRISSDQPQLHVAAEEMQRLLVHRVDPDYPLEARQANLQAVIVLDVVIGQDGAVTDVHALNGPEILARAASDSLRWWKFNPYRVNGHAVAVETTVAVEFKP